MKNYIKSMEMKGAIKVGDDINFTKAELEIILQGLAGNIRKEYREPTMEEYNIIQNVKTALGKI